MSRFWISTQICGPDVDLISKSIKKSDAQTGQSRFQGDLLQPLSNKTKNPLAANETQL